MKLQPDHSRRWVKLLFSVSYRYLRWFTISTCNSPQLTAFVYLKESWFWCIKTVARNSIFLTLTSSQKQSSTAQKYRWACKKWTRNIPEMNWYRLLLFTPISKAHRLFKDQAGNNNLPGEIPKDSVLPSEVMFSFEFYNTNTLGFWT